MKLLFLPQYQLSKIRKLASEAKLYFLVKRKTGVNIKSETINKSNK